MVESTRQVQSGDPYDRFEEAINDSRLYERYRLQQPAEPQDLDALAHDPLPIFLAEQPPNDEPAPEYSFGRRDEAARGSRIVTSLLTLSAAAAILALLSVDSTRAVIVNVSASLASVAPLSFDNAPQESPPPAFAALAPAPVQAALTSPSRDEIAAAYQTAIRRGSWRSSRRRTNRRHRRGVSMRMNSRRC
jgi:hypothetical protein